MTELEAAIIEGEELIETEYDTGDQYPKWLLELLAASRAYATLLKLVPDIKALVEAGEAATQGEVNANRDNPYDEDCCNLLTSACCCGEGRFKSDYDCGFFALAANTRPALKKLLEILEG